MITISSLSFWFNFLLFLFAVYFSFYIPGNVVLRKLQLSSFQNFVLGTIVGMVLWAWQGFVFGYLSLRFLSYFYLLIFAIVYFREFKFRWKLPKLKNLDILIFLIVFLGMFVQLVPTIGFGLEFDKGTYLCCANNDDFLYHLALTNSITRGMPPMEPGLSGEFVRNYHYWSNLVVAEISRVFHLPSFSAQFQYFNLFISFFLGLTAVSFANVLKISKSFTRWLIFLVYFGGDGIFLLLLILGKGLNDLRELLPLEDGSTFLYNPPRAFSVIVAFAALSLFVIWFKNKKLYAGVLSMILLASTVGFKVYTNLFFLMGLSILFVFLLARKDYKNFLTGIIFYPFSAIIYLSNNASSGGLFWAPFHLANEFIVQPTLNLSRLELARQIFISHNNYLRVLQYELVFLIISFLSICGTKVIALFQSIKSLLRLGKELTLVLSIGLIGGFLTGSFFLQQSGGANTFNFVVSFWIFLSIPAALALDFWQSKLSHIKKTIFIILFVSLTLPRVLDNTYFNISQFMKFGYLFVEMDLQDSFKFIRENTNEKSVIIVDPNFGYDRYSPFIEAFTQRRMFVSGEKILESHSIDVGERQRIRNIVFKDASFEIVSRELLKNNIDYIFLWENDNLSAKYNNFLPEVFKNSKTKILRVDVKTLREYIKNLKTTQI